MQEAKWRKAVFPIFVSVMMLNFVPPSLADELSEGVAAYQSGDYPKAMSIFHPLAEKGNAAAQTDVGLMFLMGQGVSKDFQEAVKWFSQAAAHGDIRGQANLGESYHSGRGVAQDFGLALKWLRLAASQGSVPAQFELGLMFAKGEGTPTDRKRAYVWFSLAADKGFQPAKVNRDIAGHSMNAHDLGAAEKLLAQCKASALTQCG